MPKRAHVNMSEPGPRVYDPEEIIVQEHGCKNVGTLESPYTETGTRAPLLRDAPTVCKRCTPPSLPPYTHFLPRSRQDPLFSLKTTQFKILSRHRHTGSGHEDVPEKEETVKFEVSGMHTYISLFLLAKLTPTPPKIKIYIFKRKNNALL